MVKDLDYLLKENAKLIREKDELYNKLNEAKEVIEAIKKGNIDAIFNENNILVSSTADQTYRRFIENMSEGVVTLHTDGMILYSNSSFAKMVNLPLERVIGANFRNFIPPDNIHKFELFFNQSDNNTKVELSFVDQEGVRAYFIVSLIKVHLQGVTALNLVCTDVTARKNAEEEVMIVNENLKRASEDRILSENKVRQLNNKLKNNIKILEDANIELAAFAHVASHDLKEPLRKIITYSSLIIRDYYDVIDQQGQNYLSNMQSASERMQSLINDILEYSELSNDFLFTHANLESIVKEVISNLEIVVTQTSAKITIEKPLPVIQANPSQLRQLFQNLITNSLKFMKVDVAPEVSITNRLIKGKELGKIGRSRQNEEFCMIGIRDNGIGFDSKYKMKIFSIFQRLHSKSLYVGTGIGLAICKKIVEQHRGFISAESELDEGSLFTVTLPVSQAIS
ncbi:MAG: ATP-binding protein [Chitinophagaceae bacterium]